MISPSWIGVVAMMWVMTTMGVSSSSMLSVPYHRQLTEYSCGDASMEMVLNYFGPDVDQRQIIDVARSTNASGTYVFDVVRALRFSRLSGPPPHVPTFAFPDQLPSLGYATRAFGLRSAARRGDACWAADARAIVAAGSPLILLMWYSDKPADGGHFRVLVGADDDGSLVLLDPWDRDGQPRVVRYSEAEFCALWKYQETDPVTGVEFPPYAAVWAAGSFGGSLTVNVSGDGTKAVASAVLSIDCPAGFDCVPSLSDVMAWIVPPEGCSVDFPNVETFPVLKLGVPLSTGAWTVACDDPMHAHSVLLFATGVVADRVPARDGWNSTEVDASYRYMDRVGGLLKPTTVLRAQLF